MSNDLSVSNESKKTDEQAMHCKDCLGKLPGGCICGPTSVLLNDLEDSLAELKKNDAVARDVIAFRQEQAVHPAHYKQGAIECIDALESALSEEEFIGGLKFNIIKCMWRAGHKDTIVDYKKAQWYLEKLIKFTER